MPNEGEVNILISFRKLGPVLNRIETPVSIPGLSGNKISYGGEAGENKLQIIPRQVSIMMPQ